VSAVLITRAPPSKVAYAGMALTDGEHNPHAGLTSRGVPEVENNRF
jgi:hypothetical protein